MGLILAVGLFLRTWSYSTLPYPPNGDELAFGYYGWSLLHFGSDEYGNRFPVYFPSIGDYKYPTLAYLNTIPAAFFGLSDLTVRFWSFTMGTVLILLVFVLGVILFDSIIAGLFAALFLAFSPWGISLSRYGYETSVATTLTTLAVVFLLIACKSYRQIFSEKLSIRFLNNRILVFSSFVIFLLSAFCYGSQRVFIPLILLTFAGMSLFRKSPFFENKKTFLLLFVLLTTIIAISLIPWQSRGRASGVLAFSLSGEQANKLAQAAIEAGISPTKVPVWLTYAFNNKYKSQGLDFVSHYLKHLESDFLFFQGEAAVERIPDMGVLLLIQIIFLPLGILFLFTNQNKFSSSFLLIWLFAAPLASALTVGGAHINRALIMLPPLTLISSFGVKTFLSAFKNKRVNLSVIAVIIILILVNGLYLLNQLFVHKPVRSPWFDETVTRTLVSEIQKYQDDYREIVIPNDNYIYFLFYEKISPRKFQEISEILPESKENQWERVARLGKIHFKMPFNCSKAGKLNVLYVCKGLSIPQNGKILSVVRYPDGLPAYTLMEFQPFSKISRPSALPERLDYMVDNKTIYPDGIIPDSSPALW